MSITNTSRSQVISKFIASPKATAFWIGILLLIVSGFLINLRHEYSKQQHALEMSSLLNAAHKNLEQILKASYNSNLAVGMTINDKGIAEDFDKVAADIIRLNPIIDIIELLPNGVIKYVYPLKTNESVVDYNILENPEIAAEAQKAIERKSVYFAGPFELKQGGQAIAGRYPIYIKDKFWGFSAVLIRFDNLMNAAGIYSLKNPNYYYQFSKISPITNKKEFFLSQSTDLDGKIYQEILIPDGEWTLYIVDKVSDPYYLSDLLPYLIICFLIVLIIPYFIYSILKRPQELALINSLQEKKMQSSDAKFQVIFNKTSIAIAQINYENQLLLEVNPQFCKLISGTVEKLTGKSFLELVHPEDVELFSKTVTITNSIFNKSTSVIVRLKNYNEGYIWTQIVPSAMLDENKSKKTLILAIENISERKIAEEKLIQSELQYKSLFHESPIPLWEEDGSLVKESFIQLGLMDKSRDYVQNFLVSNQSILFEIISKIKVISVNQECLNLYNAKDKNELVAYFMSSMKLSPTDSIIEMLVDISQGHKKGKTQGKVFFPDGTQRVYAMTWNIVAGYEESFARFIISTEDITNQISAQKLIIDSEQKLQSLINSIDGIVWESDGKTNKFSFVSAQAEAILGYTTDEWLNNENFWEEKIHEDDREMTVAFRNENIKRFNHFNSEYRVIAKNNSVVWLRNIVNVERLENNTIILKGIMIDITQIKENEKDLNKSLEMVTEQNKRLLNFSYIVSHNLRSHTSNIQSLAILIKESEDEEEKRKLIQLIDTVSNDLNETIINLNEVINIRKNVNLNVQNLKLVQFVLKTLDVISEEIRTKNIKILGKIPPDTLITYNRAYLQSILINIISNSVRYCKRNDNDRFIKFNYYEDAEFSVLEIEDNGIGINMNRYKDKVFGLYKTFSNNKDAKGIGLFITKNQVEAMGGKIEIQSELNKGTIVRIYFKN
ncbi:PAS domain-containing protein [Flavobacterium sp. SM2513]|uniref:PAS domain-containing protein n=1 Tax=Flavobacterium sp. SM2513 TaxID=3424766 RepID=UPI003D7FA373